MKKILCLLIACCMIAFCACEKNDSKTAKKNNDIAVAKAQEIVMPEPFGSFGEDTGSDTNMSYYDTCDFKINSLSISFETLVNQNDLEEWTKKTNCVDNNNTSIRDVFGLYSFIIYFNIPDEAVRNILVKQREFYISQEVNDEYYFTDEEIDLLLSKDDKAVAEYFVNENAIEKDGKIYSPKWIYTHSMKDYIKEGLSAELVNEKVDNFIDDIPFTEEAKKALETKVDAYSNVLEQEKIADNNSEK